MALPDLMGLEHLSAPVGLAVPAVQSPQYHLETLADRLGLVPLADRLGPQALLALFPLSALLESLQTISSCISVWLLHTSN